MGRPSTAALAEKYGIDNGQFVEKKFKCLVCERFGCEEHELRPDAGTKRATHVIADLGELRDVVEEYLEQPAYAYDLETDSLRTVSNNVLWVSMATTGRTDVIACGHPVGEMLYPARKYKVGYLDQNDITSRGKPRKKWSGIQTIPPVFTDPPRQLRVRDVMDTIEPLLFSDQLKIGHNLKFDLQSVMKYFGGEAPPPPYADTMIGAFLINSDRVVDLKGLTKKTFAHEYEKSAKGGILDKPFSEIATYAGQDSKWTWLLWQYIEPALKKYGLEKVWRLEMDVLESLVYMETAGAFIDRVGIQRLEKALAKDLTETEKKIFRELGRVVNLDSTPEKQRIVYQERGHKPFAFTKGCKNIHPHDDRAHTDRCQPSTKAEVLEAFAGTDPVVANMLEYAETKKLHSTYAVGLIDLLTPEGRLHANFKQHGTKTGRFSCSEPNLQNIPRRGEKAKKIRRLFVAPPGHQLVVADYAALELRILAHYSGEPTLLKVFEEDGDPHGATASLIFGFEVGEDDPERDIGKTVNFAIPFGAGPATVGAQAGVSVKRAKEILAMHQRTQPKVYDFIDKVISTARKRKPPYVKTITGRRRYLPTMWSRDSGLRRSAERQAVNTIIQGTGGDIIKMAMVKAHRELPDDMQMLLSVHDELMISVPDERVDEGIHELQRIMESIDVLRVPLKAEAKPGRNWAEAK